jgi:copper homeostasis protein CutC
MDSFNSFTIEACVSDISSAINAIQGGVYLLEICCNRIEGGCAPSFGFVEQENPEFQKQYRS